MFLVLFLVTPHFAEGHAFISFPPLRGGTKPGPINGWSPQSLGSTKLPMPTCGNNKMLAHQTGPFTKLKAGQKIEFHIKVTAHHKGHFVFRLCDHQLGTGTADPEACLKQHILKRVKPEEAHSDCKANDRRGDCQPYDYANPGYWYVPPSVWGDTAQIAGQFFTDADANKTAQKSFVMHPSLVQNEHELSSMLQVHAKATMQKMDTSESVSSERTDSSQSANASLQNGIDYRFHYWLPKNVQCTRCTIQWRWMSANSCTPHPDAYKCYFQNMTALGWNAQAWCSGVCVFKGNCPSSQGSPTPCGEEFANCADVEIRGNGGGTQPTANPPHPPATPTPTNPPVTGGPTMAPTNPPATVAPTHPPATPMPTSAPGAQCIQDKDCQNNPWCKAAGFATWCDAHKKTCPSPYCKVVVNCKAKPGNSEGVTDAFCSRCAEAPFCRNSKIMDAFCEAKCKSGPSPTSPPLTPAPTTPPAAGPTILPTSPPEPEPEPSARPPTPGPTSPPVTAAPTNPPSTPLGCTTCKAKCQAACNSNLKTNQCWGTPRYVECLCTDGSRHVFAGCECKHGNCQQLPPVTAAPTAPPITTVPANPPSTAAPTQPPATGTTVSPPATSPPSPGRKINVCYFTNWARYRTGLINSKKDVFELDGISANLCSHFMYGFATVDAQFNIKPSDPNADNPTGSAQQTKLCPSVCNDPNFTPDWSKPGQRCNWPCSPKREFRGFEGMNVAMKKKNRDIKTLISVGGWNFNDCNGPGKQTCEIFSTIAASDANIRTFSRNVIKFCRDWAFDGFDLDWEYPVVAGHNSLKRDANNKLVKVPQDFTNYVKMLKVMKEEFRKESPANPLLLTAAVGVGKSTTDTAYDIPGMSQHLDLINLMTYDLHGAWESRTGCNANLYATKDDMRFGGGVGSGKAVQGYPLSVSWAVDYWIKKGAPPSKLTLGYGTYGRGWRLQDPNKNGYNAPATGASKPGICTKEAGYISYYEILEKLKDPATKKVYDNDRQCPYIITSDGEWIGYDDEKSIRAKADFARSRNLAGAMVWALDLDDFTGYYSNGNKYPLIDLMVTRMNSNAGPTVAPPPGTVVPTSGPPAAPTASPTVAPEPEPEPETVAPTLGPTAAPTGTPGTSVPPGSNPLVDAVVKALKSSTSAGVFMYNTGTKWIESTLYTWPDMTKAVELMATQGVGALKLWVGEAGKHNYGLVNIAAFLAQCMQETIQYNACDENNWSDGGVIGKVGGTKYSSTSACGQLSQSYQDYKCSAQEDAIAGGQMACPVDTNMEMRATTHASWYGAPAKLFCAPKSKVPKAPRWDTNGWCQTNPNGWGYVKPFKNSDPLSQYWTYVNKGGSAGGTCKDYLGQKGGKWTFSGCGTKGCAGSAAPLFGKPAPRTDVEGCCWWGRGVIQTTGVCNFGKLNYYLGKRAATEGRPSLFPTIDFCQNPSAICEDGSPGHLKWVAGFFYWLNAVQPYEKSGWKYTDKLKKWVDDGMQMSDTDFINGASGIVNRGCHNPPHCGTGNLHGGAARIKNFEKVLTAMGLVGGR